MSANHSIFRYWILATWLKCFVTFFFSSFWCDEDTTTHLTKHENPGRLFGAATYLICITSSYHWNTNAHGGTATATEYCYDVSIASASNHQFRFILVQSSLSLWHTVRLSCGFEWLLSILWNIYWPYFGCLSMSIVHVSDTAQSQHTQGCFAIRSLHNQQQFVRIICMRRRLYIFYGNQSCVDVEQEESKKWNSISRHNSCLQIRRLIPNSVKCLWIFIWTGFDWITNSPFRVIRFSVQLA